MIVAAGSGNKSGAAVSPSGQAHSRNNASSRDWSGSKGLPGVIDMGVIDMGVIDMGVIDMGVIDMGVIDSALSSGLLRH